VTPSTGASSDEVGRLLGSIGRLLGVELDKGPTRIDTASLTAAQSLRVASHISATLDVDLRPSDVPVSGSLRGLVEFAVEIARSPDAARRADRDPRSAAPLSHAQARLLLAEQLVPGAADANAVGAYVLDAPLDTDALRSGFADVLRRHPVLRTVYGWDEDGTPVQRAVENGAGIALDFKTGIAPDEEPQHIAERACAPWWDTPLDLEAAPPVRARVVPLDADRHLLCFSIHHVAFDGWSAWLLRRDLARAYSSRARGREPEWEPIPSYRGYIWWERDQLPRWEAADLPYWRKLLAVPAPPILPMSAAPEAPARERNVTLDPPMVAAIVEGGRRAHALPLSVLMTSVAEALGQRFQVSRVCLGTIFSGRFDREFHPVIGCFVNPVAVMVELQGGRTHEERLIHVTDSLFGALSHGRTPFDELVRILQPAARRHPWFQVLVLLHEIPALGRDVGDGVELAPVTVRAPRTSLDLVVEVMPQLEGGWLLTVRWRCDRLHDEVADALLDDVVASLRATGDCA
jgi:hypothetical protein